MKRVLIIDDDMQWSALVRSAGEDLGLEVQCAHSKPRFMELYDASCPELVVLDIVLQDTDCFEVLNFLAERKTTCPIIVISGYDEKYGNTAEAYAKALNLNYFARLAKPMRLVELEQALRSATTLPH